MDNNSNNVNFNTNKQPSLHKSRSNASFGHAAVAKSDVGDFQEGYFVMAEMPSLPQQQRNKTHKTPERNQRKNEQRQHQREQSTKHIEQLLQRESDPHVSNVRTTTSPNRSPTRNSNKRTSPQRNQTTYTSEHQTTPHKPRKANSQIQLHHEKRVERYESSPSLLESSSPPKEKGPSPTPNRWAGPAFSNAPPPSSLPIPDFPPFSPSETAPSQAATTPILSSSPPTLSPVLGPTFVPPMMYHEPVLSYIPHQPPVYAAPVAYNGYPGFHLAYDIPSQPPSLAQLSTDLRRMLNIGGQPIPA